MFKTLVGYVTTLVLVMLATYVYVVSMTVRMELLE